MKTRLSERAMKWAERAYTNYFLWSVLIAAAVPIAVFCWVVTRPSISVKEASGFLDPVVKLLVVVVGASWALNRFFVNRTDASHLRFDYTVDLVPDADPATPGSALLLYRVEFINTGKVLVKDYTIEVELASVTIGPVQQGDLGGGGEPGVRYEPLDHLDPHPAGALEPGGWGAVSRAVKVGADLRAVRILVEIKPRSGYSWNSHRLLPVGSDPGAVVGS